MTFGSDLLVLCARGIPYRCHTISAENAPEERATSSPKTKYPLRGGIRLNFGIMGARSTATMAAWLAVAIAAVAATSIESASATGFIQRPAEELENMSTRIFGGDYAEEHEFPYQVYVTSLLKSHEDSALRSTYCGGTILSEKWILTAAHCVNNSRKTDVGFGSANKYDLEYRSAERLIVHENYTLYGRYLNNAANDLGLVELKNPITLNVLSTSAAKLPNSSYVEPSSKLVLGWGRWTNEFIYGSSPVLKKFSVNIIHCPEETPGVICVQSEDKSGLCDGDSGGPLMIDGVIYGVASYVDHKNQHPNLKPNEHCNKVDSYAVFMSVLEHRNWIRYYTGL